MDKHYVLRRYFGFEAFRSGQEDLVDAILAGRDVLGIMPTGGGKSLCYQVPAMVFSGVTIVISPLISLMKDQVMALQSVGVPSAFINSSLDLKELQRVYDKARRGEYKLLYVAPERLETIEFIDLASSLDLALVAVDEAHCISQWGQDFRPSYLRIPDFLERLPKRPTLAAFTATATERVREDICKNLSLRAPKIVITGFDRPNLRFLVETPEKKDEALLSFLREDSSRSGIIYCATRKSVEKLCEKLCLEGFEATRYHAGLSDEERARNQEDFLHDVRPLMVATNAFGMGIDKSNVNFVVHYNMPKSLEAYYQEAGRAGRDGTDATCLLLFSTSDIVTAKRLIMTGRENEQLSEAQRQLVVRENLRRLKLMVGYCRSEGCLRGTILDYFSQPHAEKCGNCGNCIESFEKIDITREAQMILSCILRIHAKLGYYVGATLVVRTLRGSKDARVEELGLDTISTYALLKDVDRKRVRIYLDALEQKGYIYIEETHLSVRTTEAAKRVLFEGERVEIRAIKEADAQSSGRQKKKSGRSAPKDDALLSTLKKLRLKLAQEAHVPAYIVFSNATLIDMAAKRPTSMKEFLSVSGVGEVKAARYGKIFIQAIREFEG